MPLSSPPSLLKIIMIAPYPSNPNIIHGGVEAVTVNLVKGFSEINQVELLIVSMQKNVAEETTVQIAENISVLNIPYGKIRSTKLEMLFHGRKKIKTIIKEFNPDLIHIQGNGSKLLLTVGMNYSKLIITQHGILKEELKTQSKLRSKLSLLINLFIEKIIWMNIKNIVFISNYNRNLFGSDRIRKIKSALISNPVNPLFFEIKGTTDNNIRVVYVGGIMKRKGLLDLLKTLAILKEQNIIYHLDIVGGVVDLDYANEITRFIKQNNLNSQVSSHGWLSQTEILNLYENIDILVLPSYQETLPVCVAEAMSAGKLVIASNVGGLSEMIEDGESGFLYKKGDIKELQNIFIKLNDNPDLTKQIRYNARIKATERYSSSSVAEQTVRFYKQILNQEEDV